MANDIEDLVSSLLNKSNPGDQLENLSNLRKILNQKEHTSDFEEDVFDEDLFLEEDLPIRKTFLNKNPFPGSVLDRILEEQQLLNEFVCFVIVQRFGWKEKNGMRNTKKEVLSQIKAHSKPEIANILDDFIKWFQYQPIHAEIIQSYVHTIEEASKKPLVRKQTFNVATEWLKIMLPLESLIHEEEFSILKEMLLLGLSDVWSAVRNTVVGRLSSIIEFFYLSQIQEFFQSLVEICQSSESTWQAKEGAIMAINTIIRRFRWVGIEQTQADRVIKEDVITESPTTQYFLQFGQEELGGLPDFISSQLKLKSTLFPLLAHPQLTIRENAIKAFSSYLSRCEFKEALSAFKAIIQQLCRDIPYDISKKPPHLVVLDSKFKFLDAFEAEGLLGVCVCLVKHIPPGFLLPNWPLYFSTFCLYLSHPASIVRQTASNVFKFLVAKDSHNPIILKLVLQGLSCEWNVNQAQLTEPCNMAVDPALYSGRIESVQAAQNIFRVNGSSENPQRPSIVDMSHIEKVESDIFKSWEWREGRLLAYEVILQFLIKNHIIYTFGSLQQEGVDSNVSEVHTLPHPGVSVDEMFLRKTNLGNESNGQPESSSYGGSSLKQSLKRSFSDKRKKPQVPNNQPADYQYKKEVGMARRYGGVRYSRARNSISTCSPSNELPPPSIYSDRSTLASSESPTAKLFASHPRKTLQRLPTFIGYHSPSLKTLVKHYSYYTEGGGPSAVPQPSYSGNTASLLMHTLALDIQPENQIGNVKSPLKPWEEKSAAKNHDRERLKSTLCPSTLSDAENHAWIETVHIPSLAKQLTTILYQCIECLADTQWELRRMAQQLLPCVVEVIRWYDMKILEDLWKEHLSPTTTLVSYGASLALQHSILTCGKLLPLLKNPPTRWMDGDLCRQVVLRIIHSMNTHVASWLTQVHASTQRPCYDKLTLINMDIIILANTHFKLKQEQRVVQIASIVAVFREVFITAHPDVQLANKLEAHRTANLYQFLTPIKGFLSCIPLRADGVPSAARQVEKAMLQQLQANLSSFIQRSDIQDIITMLPILAFYVGHYADMDTFHKGITDSLSSLAILCNQVLTKKSFERKQDIYENCVAALRELSDAIRIKSVDINIVRSVVDLYQSLSQNIAAEDHIIALFNAIFSRLINLNKKVPVLSQYSSQVSDDISEPLPVSSLTQTESQSSDTDDELDIPVNGLVESQMLTISSLSGGRNSSRRSISGGDVRPASSLSEEVATDSDWDSWDDEEEDEDLESWKAIFADFLRKLESHNNAKAPGSFTECLNLLQPQQREFIRDLL